MGQYDLKGIFKENGTAHSVYEAIVDNVERNTVGDPEIAELKMRNHNQMHPETGEIEELEKYLTQRRRV
jgi:hypothetical protein